LDYFPSKIALLGLICYKIVYLRNNQKLLRMNSRNRIISLCAASFLIFACSQPKTSPEASSDVQTEVLEQAEVIDRAEAPEQADLEGVWVVTTIASYSSDGQNLNMPTISINVEGMTYSGQDGCNRYFGAVQALTESTISFSDSSSTKMACPDAQTPIAFYTQLRSVAGYEVSDTVLTMRNEAGNNVLSFAKQ
jgi:heat shock protein HslJ